MDYVYSVKLENGIKLEVKGADSLDTIWSRTGKTQCGSG